MRSIADTTANRDDEEDLADDGVGPVMPLPASAAEHPTGTEFSPSESADVDRLDDPLQQSSTFEPASATIPTQDADEPPPTMPNNDQRGGAEPVGDDFDDEDQGTLYLDSDAAARSEALRAARATRFTCLLCRASDASSRTLETELVQ